MLNGQIARVAPLEGLEREGGRGGATQTQRGPPRSPLSAPSPCQHITSPGPAGREGVVVVVGGIKSDVQGSFKHMSPPVFAEGLKEYFCKFGEVKECMVMRDPVTKRSR